MCWSFFSPLALSADETAVREFPPPVMVKRDQVKNDAEYKSSIPQSATNIH